MAAERTRILTALELYEWRTVGLTSPGRMLWCPASSAECPLEAFGARGGLAGGDNHQTASMKVGPYNAVRAYDAD